MPQSDTQWPTEDEEFDATIGSDDNTPKVQKNEIKVDEAPDASQPEPEVTPAPEPETKPVADIKPANEPTPAAKPAPKPTSVPPTIVSSAAATSTKPTNPRNYRTLLRPALEAVLVLLVIGLGLWCWNLSTDNSNLKNQVAQLNANPQAIIQKQTEALIAQVGRLMNLPTGETPTIANVTDAAQARQQSAFFKDAQNGDKVLMYVKAGEAILYRPSTNKIILVAPLTFNNTATSGTSNTTTSTTKK